MKGTRPLDNEEILEVSKHFNGKYAIRNRCLFIIGVSCGGRISELISLKIKDIWQHEKPIADLVFNKNIVKGGELSRTVPLNIDGRNAVTELVQWITGTFPELTEPHIFENLPLFPSRNKSGGLKALTRKGAYDVLKNAFETAGLNGKLATHSLRKSFAQRLYEQTSDIYIIKEMLGHKSVDTTQKYLGVKYVTVKEAVEAMAIACHGTQNLTPIYRATDDELLLEMVRRGYSVEKQRQHTQNDSPH